MESDPRRTSDLLRAWALEEGFDRVGLARLEPSAHGGHFRRWLERGDHAGMAWLERRVEVREDPSRLLPESRSALCVALHYAPLRGPSGEIPEPRGDLWPGVARYARGEDYHELMGRRLRRLAQRIETAFPGCRSRPYVDTGPILERELQARAGIGRIGKNTNLLHREAGSWFLVGELLLTLDVEPDEPLGDMCGSCTRCLDACPTGALREPYRLDSRRCISYWNIEHRGEVPEAARRLLGDWVFGCDVCQEVCPWNHRPAGGEHPELELPASRRQLGLVQLLLLEREEYVERFRRSPMKRAKLDGLRRNAALVMGNRGDHRYVPSLVRALETASPLVRRHAAWSLGEIGGKKAEEALRRAAAEQTDADVVEEVRRALVRIEAAPGSSPP